MKTKLQIIQSLLDERKINAEEAVILLEKEKEYVYIPQYQYWPYQPYFINPISPTYITNPIPNYSTTSELTINCN